MKIWVSNNIFCESDRIISINKNFGDDILLRVDIAILSEKFVEYQKDLFTEFVSLIIDKLNESDLSIWKFQKFYETTLQDFNIKLAAFAWKIKDGDYFPVKWAIQIFFDETYIASMIWDSSILIFRNKQLNYIIDNKPNPDTKIDLFSEFIEWDLENNDEIMILWLNVENYLDKKDINDEIWLNLEENIDKTIIKLLLSKTSEQEVCLSIFSKVDLGINFSKLKSEKSIKLNLSFIKTIKSWLENYKYPVIVWLWVLVIVFFLYSIISSFFRSDTLDVIVNDDGSTRRIKTIEEIKKDIAMFDRIDPNSDEKIKKYEIVMQNLNDLEEKKINLIDVKELKWILNEEYYKWFKIDSITYSELKNDTILEFNTTELSTLWDPISINYNQSFSVGWTKWAIIWHINDKIRWWSLINYNLPINIKWCVTNLLRNWLYCYNDEWWVYNITKNWIETVTTKSWSFPQNIDWMAIYAKNKIYTLTSQKEYNDKSTYVLRYVNALWSQTNFGEGSSYTIQNDSLVKYGSGFASWFNNLSIDGNILTWSPSDKSIYQYQSADKSIRPIKLIWWDKLLDWYSDNVKIMSFQDSNYVYLFDKTNQTFTVYKSRPAKRDRNDYNLYYYFKLKFNLGEELSIIDTFVEIWEKNKLYLLTSEWIYKINLYEYFQSFEFELEQN